jgi:hypothetical protein
MGFAFDPAPGGKLPPVTGPSFRSHEYAVSFFKLLRAWNYDKDVDSDDNVKLSFILEDNGDYSVYLYPSMDRQSLREAFGDIEESTKGDKPGKELQKLVVQFTLCKSFPHGPASSLDAFVGAARKAGVFHLRAFEMKDENAGGELVMLWDIDPIAKNDFKFKKRSELLRGEVEYEHGKKVMNL